MTEAVAPAAPRQVGRRRAVVRIEGIVQGVGFRPFVYRLATEMDLTGTVRNDGGGVYADVEGPAGAVDAFVQRLRTGGPPLARIDGVSVERLDPLGTEGFRIVESHASPGGGMLIGPDVAPCAACLAEMSDPEDRRWRYPFINCTDCGPRWTIVRGLPYDRPRTTMAGFDMCEECRAEYGDPTHRRFHAQPNACPGCGPTARLLDARGQEGPRGRDARDAVARAAAALVAGAIVAVKGVGGWHLACRADAESVVARLRTRKRRPAKPLAIMVADLEAARGVAVLEPDEEALLTAMERPIVLCRRRVRAPIAPSVAPGHRELGVMLPSSPLHHLLLADAAMPLVMTSGNASGDPTVIGDREAFRVLGAVADLFLVHDRPIEARADDSVVRVVRVAGRRRPVVLRRARGYVPLAVPLPFDAPPTLAVGAALKSTVCVARGRSAWVGPHLGDLERWEARRSYREGVRRLESLTGIEPERVAHDLHPDYPSTAFALEHHRGLPAAGVQHHHAHMAACMVEHGRTAPVLAAVFDGTGYGPDGTVWGGELLFGDLSHFERVGGLHPVRMPGGEAAVREPWRMACAWLAAADLPTDQVPPSLADAIDPARWDAVRSLAAAGPHAPLTSSMGRLFDAVAALCGVRAEVGYEGQAAIELEALAAGGRGDLAAYEFTMRGNHGAGEPLTLDARPVIRAVHRDVAAEVAVRQIAAAFHEGVARACARALVRLARSRGVDAVVLSGGVFQNPLLLDRTSMLLARHGLHVLVPEAFPPNDGGIALGQAVVAAAGAA